MAMTRSLSVLIAWTLLALMPAPAGGQSYASAEQCMQALWSRCVSLMDPNAKRSCVQGNKVYCARFDGRVIVPKEDVPFSDRVPNYQQLEGFTRPGLTK